MFYNKFNKWISILLCTSICIGSPSITSMANPISAAASQKYQIQSINKDSNNNLLNEVQDFDRQSSYTNIFNTNNIFYNYECTDMTFMSDEMVQLFVGGVNFDKGNSELERLRAQQHDKIGRAHV